MTELAKREQGQVVPADAGSIMAVISRAASDPTTDVVKLEKMLEMYERITAKNSEALFNQAMAAAQSEMKRVAADAANPQTRSLYASYAALDRMLRPIYTQHGFALSFDTADSQKPEHVLVLCYVAHRDGHSRTYRVDMPADGKGAKGGDVMTRTHATGSAITYGQRYLLKAIFNVAIGVDDDGNGGDKPITEKQLADLKAKITEVGANQASFMKFLKVEALEDLPASKYDAAIKALDDKAKGARK